MVMRCTYCVAVCILDFSWPLVEFSVSPSAEFWTKVRCSRGISLVVNEDERISRKVVSRSSFYDYYLGFAHFLNG